MRVARALGVLAVVVGVGVAATYAPRLAPRLTIARLQYDGGGDWYANPSSLPNLLRAVRERTSLPVEKEEARDRQARRVRRRDAHAADDRQHAERARDPHQCPSPCSHRPRARLLGGPRVLREAIGFVP